MTSTPETAVAPPATAPAGDLDADDLSEFGYEQQLHRSLGKFASFAAGFSFVSILTTIFQLFGLGFGFGGPAFFWTWPIVYAGQFLVALCFAEIAARYPISGAIYQWSRRLGGEVIGWFGGWFMMIAQIVTAAAAAIALQVVLPAVWTGFQIVGDDPTLTSTSGAANAVLLGSILLVIVTAINCVGVTWMSRVNSIGVICELVGVTAVILALFTHARRGPRRRLRHRRPRAATRLHLGVHRVRPDGRICHGRIRFRRRARRGDPGPATGRTAHHPDGSDRLRRRRWTDAARCAHGSADAR